MPAWKVLLIGLLGMICIALTMATILVGLEAQGQQGWLLTGGLLTGTLVTGTLLVLFLRHAGAALETKPSWSRRS
jgi:hypothetical protein